MENMNFIPRWYLEGKDKQKSKYVKVLDCIVASIVIILIIIYFINVNRINNIDEQINKVKAINDNSKSSKYENTIKDVNTLNCFEDFINNMNDKIQYREVDINGKDISLEISVNSVKEYIEFVRFIESNKKYTIKSLSSLEQDGDKFKYRIVIEVKL